MDRGNGPSEINRASRNERHSGQCRIRVVRRVLLVLLLYFSLALFVYLRLMPRWAERFEKDRQSASDSWLTARDNVVRHLVLPVELARLHSITFYKLTDSYLRKNWGRFRVYARMPSVCRWRFDMYSSSGVRIGESFYSPKGHLVGFYRRWNEETGALIIEIPYNESGKLHGEWKRWNYEGRLFQLKTYSNGIPNGPYFLEKREGGVVKGTWRDGRMHDGTFTVEYQPMAPNGTLDYSDFGTALVSNNVLLRLFHDTELKSPVAAGVMTGWFFWDEASRNAARHMVEGHRVGVVFSNGVPISLRDVGKSDGADIRVPPGDLSQCDFRMMIDPMIHDDVVRFGFRNGSCPSEDVALEGVDKQEESPAD